MIDRTQELRAQILHLAGEYCAEKFAPRPFVPAESSVPVSGKVFDASEMRTLVHSALDFWHNVAVGFPATINPIIRNGLVPVFVDGIARREGKMEIPILAGYYVLGIRRTLHHAEIGQAPLTNDVGGGNRGAS
jgi:hypothetical protein